MSQRTLGLKAGIPYSSVGHFETGMRVPTIETLRRIGRALNVSTDFLLGDVPDIATNDGGVYRDYFSSQVTEARRFFFSHTSSAQATRVLSGGLEHCAPDYAIRRDSFPYYCLEYVVRGHGEVTLNGARSVLQPGRTYLYRPNMPHEIVGDPTDRLVKYFVVFAGANVSDELAVAGIAAGDALQIYPPDVLAGLFDEMIAIGVRAGRGSENLCAKLLECLFLRLVGVVSPTGANEIAAFKTYQHCRRVVEDGFQQLGSPAEIAVACGIDEADLSMLFRQYGRQSPEQYLLRLKMNFAAGCLQKPDAHVGAIASSVGYPDPHRFANAFHDVLGVTPDAFKKLSKAYG